MIESAAKDETYVHLLIEDESAGKVFVRRLVPTWHVVEEVVQQTSLIAHHQSGHEMKVGTREIGRWGLPQRAVPLPERNLNGSVDQYLNYQEPLSSDEIATLDDLRVPK